MAKIKDLQFNPENPRTITPEKLSQLKKSVKTYGDLSGFVYNVKTKRFVGGHQRSKVVPPGAQIHITQKLPKPSKVGTTAVGYVEVDGERFSYREVSWDSTFEKGAAIAANRNAGEWDQGLLSDWMRELDDFGMDMELTMFDTDEIEDFLTPTLRKNFDESDETHQTRLDKKKPVVCPECDHEFTP